MKYLARIILSIESLIKNPIDWFRKLAWVLKMIIVFTFIPLISAVSILSYQNLEKKELILENTDEYGQISKKDLDQALEKYQDTQIEEIVLLREEIRVLKQAISLSNGDIDLDSPLVLGVQDSTDSIKNLREIISATLDDPNFKSVYIKTDNANTIMYVEPSKTSEKITDFEVGVVYPALTEQDNWQEIGFGNGKTAWIEKQYIINFPIDENY